MHRCKIESKAEVIITKEEYQQQCDVVKGTSFEHFYDKIDNNSALKTERHVGMLPFTIKMKRNLLSLYTIPVLIENKTYWFLLDTGAQVSAIRQSMLDKVRFIKDNQECMVEGFGGVKNELKRYVCPMLQIGSIIYHNLKMLLLDEKTFAIKVAGFDLMRFDGIIGWDILSQLDFEMDDVKKQFKVIKNKYRFIRHNLINGGFPLVLVKDQNNQIYRFGFDSGAQVCWLGKKWMENSEHVSKTYGIGFGVHGKQKMELSLLDHLELDLDRGRIILDDIMDGVVDFFPEFSFDGVLGSEVIKNRRIRFINSENKVLFR